jgi:hypothetical protein
VHHLEIAPIVLGNAHCQSIWRAWISRAKRDIWIFVSARRVVRAVPFCFASVDVPMIMLRMLELERPCLVITADAVQVCAAFRTIRGHTS